MIEYELKSNRVSAEPCMQLKTGSCMGCAILAMIADKARWQRMSTKQAAEEIGQCAVIPQTRLVQNQWASLGMGQRREENLDFSSTEVDREGQKLHEGVLFL